LKEEVDNPKAVELEALYDKICLSTQTGRVFRRHTGRIQREIETRELSEAPVEKLFVMHAHFYLGAQHALPGLTCQVAFCGRRAHLTRWKELK